ncbi:hypothetical protein DRL70_23450 [Salmonella enterica subsp. enterica serovar Bareilly]|nr:hypothetical protein [Salmonella enterica subsp. enterica serovar Bareilly]
MTTITREQALKIIEAADEVISALAGTNEDVHPGSDNMLRLWDDLNDRYAPPEVVRELARIALASLEAEPIGEVSEKRHGLVMDGTVDLGGKSTYRIIKGEKAMKLLPLGTKFYIAPPAPVIQADVAQAIENLKQKLVECNRYNYCADAVKGVEDACRAVMLQSGNFRESDVITPDHHKQAEKSGLERCHLETALNIKPGHTLGVIDAMLVHEMARALLPLVAEKHEADHANES